MNKMNISQRTENWAGPIDSPLYPPLPAYYRNVEFQIVYFRTDEKRVALLLPEQFEPAEGGLCVAVGINVPFCSNYGPFQETIVASQVVFRGEKGFYAHAVLLNNDAAIAAGREIYGTPKKYAHVNITREGNTITTTCSRNGVPIVQLTSKHCEPASLEDMIPVFPIFMLKVMPRVDKPEPLVKQVTSTPLTETTCHALFKGPGTVRFEPSVDGGFWCLEPKEVLGAFYQVLSYTEGYGRVVYDYLAKGG